MDSLDFDFEERIERAETLPARCYTDATYLSLEQLRIFNRAWQHVGPLDQDAEPGSYCAADVVGGSIVVVRGQDGELRGFHNVCRRRAGPVAQGSGRCKNLQRGYHGWTDATDGRLIGVPDFDGVACFN